MSKTLAYQISGAKHTGRWLVTCDHACNHVPDELEGDLGVSQADMSRHIAFDIGARGLSHALADKLSSPCIESTFSRLVIDPNRGEDDPTLVMKIYDGTLIPKNRYIDDTEIERRLSTYYRPYHSALNDLLQQQENRVICAIHSFTPQLKGHAKRPWQIAVLSGSDKRLTAPLIKNMRECVALKAEAARLGEPLHIGDNMPYSVGLPGDSTDRHAIKTGRANVLIELRNDLIETEEDQDKWAALLAPHLEITLQQTGL